MGAWSTGKFGIEEAGEREEVGNGEIERAERLFRVVRLFDRLQSIDRGRIHRVVFRYDPLRYERVDALTQDRRGDESIEVGSNSAPGPTWNERLNKEEAPAPPVGLETTPIEQVEARPEATFAPARALREERDLVTLRAEDSEDQVSLTARVHPDNKPLKVHASPRRVAVLPGRLEETKESRQVCKRSTECLYVSGRVYPPYTTRKKGGWRQDSE